MNNSKPVTNTQEDRIFSCAKWRNNPNTNESHVENLFTILKGGSLYIGGSIWEYTSDDGNTYRDPLNLDNLGHRVYVTNPGISITNGQLHLAFSSVIDTTTTQNLTDFIQNAVSQGTSGLVGNHWHNVYANWTEPRFEEGWDLNQVIEELRRAFNSVRVLVRDDAYDRAGWTGYVE